MSATMRSGEPSTTCNRKDSRERWPDPKSMAWAAPQRQVDQVESAHCLISRDPGRWFVI